MGFSLKSRDLLFPTDRNGSCELFYRIFCRKSHYLTLPLLLTRTQSFSQVISTSALRHEYTSTSNTKISVNMVLNVHRNRKAYWGRGEGAGGRWYRGWGKREIIYLSLHCHHQNDSCIDGSHFNVSLIVRDKVTR